jgi:hypothetical protein
LLGNSKVGGHLGVGLAGLYGLDDFRLAGGRHLHAGVRLGCRLTTIGGTAISCREPVADSFSCHPQQHCHPLLGILLRVFFPQGLGNGFHLGGCLVPLAYPGTLQNANEATATHSRACCVAARAAVAASILLSRVCVRNKGNEEPRRARGARLSKTVTREWRQRLWVPYPFLRLNRPHRLRRFGTQYGWRLATQKNYENKTGFSGNRCERRIFPADEAKASTASKAEGPRSNTRTGRKPASGSRPVHRVERQRRQARYNTRCGIGSREGIFLPARLHRHIRIALSAFVRPVMR